MVVFLIGLLAHPTLEVAVVDFDALTLPAALELDGRLVQTTFVVGCPAYTLGGVTVVGLGEQEDGVGRVVYLPLTDADEGDVVTVEGVIRVRHHPATVINKQVVPAWDEIRIEDTKLVE